MRYEIEKITDIFDIPEESFDDFIVDLKSYYQFGKSIPDLIDEIASVGGIKVKTIPQKMVWIDDKKHDVEIVLKPSSSKEKNQ